MFATHHRRAVAPCDTFLGNWKPLGVLAGTLVFGLAEAVAIFMQSSGASLFPNELFIALPYILTIVLTVARRYSLDVPAELGVPLQKRGIANRLY